MWFFTILKFNLNSIDSIDSNFSLGSLRQLKKLEPRRISDSNLEAYFCSNFWARNFFKSSKKFRLGRTELVELSAGLRGWDKLVSFSVKSCSKNKYIVNYHRIIIDQNQEMQISSDFDLFWSSLELTVRVRKDVNSMHFVIFFKILPFGVGNFTFKAPKKTHIWPEMAIKGHKRALEVKFGHKDQNWSFCIIQPPNVRISHLFKSLRDKRVRSTWSEVSKWGFSVKLPNRLFRLSSTKKLFKIKNDSKFMSWIYHFSSFLGPVL